MYISTNVAKCSKRFHVYMYTYMINFISAIIIIIIDVCIGRFSHYRIRNSWHEQASSMESSEHSGYTA